MLRRFFGLVCAALLSACLNGCGSTPPTTGNQKVMIKGEAFDLEVVADEATRQRGLMYRDHIPEHGGMLFVFPDSQVIVQRFWMGNCLVDMDIIFLDPAGHVTATHRMKAEVAQRADESETDYDRRMPRYSSAYPAQFAIELKAGSLDRLNVRVEDKIDLDIPALKAMAR